MCVLLLLMCPFGLVLQMFQLFLPYFCVVDGHRKQRLLHSALKLLHAPLILDAVSFLFTGWHPRLPFDHYPKISILFCQFGHLLPVIDIPSSSLALTFFSSDY